MERCILLISSFTSTQAQEISQRRMEAILTGKQIAFDKIDGGLEENKEIRNTLFGISSHRGQYPQCFIRKVDGSYKFIGLWEQFESLTDCETLPKDVLEANPTIETISSVFKDCEKST